MLARMFVLTLSPIPASTPSGWSRPSSSCHRAAEKIDSSFARHQQKLINSLVNSRSHLDEAEPDVVLPDVLVGLAEERGGRDALELLVPGQPLDEAVVGGLVLLRAQVDLIG